jgi:hypothetical protein
MTLDGRSEHKSRAICCFEARNPLVFSTCTAVSPVTFFVWEREKNKKTKKQSILDFLASLVSDSHNLV